jgi:chemotaxis family two-component system response regulator Rcp1
MSTDAPRAAAIQIFLAEDNPGDVRLIREALKLHEVSFDLHVFDDGDKALGFIGRLADPEEVCPDVILLDLNLPRTDGRDILKRVRQISRTQSVPVIVLSSSESPKDRAEAVSLGANRYVRKPSTFDEFMAIGALVKELVHSTS